MHDLIPLNFLAAGQQARIGDVVGRVDYVHRLEELGLRRGEVVEMVQPGTPCIIQIGGARVCFRDGEAFGVLVRLGEVA
jgi:ferrous iron transport protein A